MFHYYQVEGGEEAWRAVPQNELERLKERRSPMFVTVLSVDRLISDDTSKEDLLKAGYSGPLYFDWDSPSIAAATEDTGSMLTHLESMGVNLDCCKLYATGGKGYHMEVPFECLVRDQRKPVPLLPIVYKEMAMALAVDSLDLRVYSTRRGRMWRQPNVLRPNGRYKVPITFEELKSMTPEKYENLTSAPRSEPLRPAPEYALDLAMEYERCRQKVESAGRSKLRRKEEPNLTAKMPSIEALLEGRGLREGAGFQQISLQLTILAHNFGWTEDELIARADGLIHSHEGDGVRYNTVTKRIVELRRMWRYTEDNPGYEVSVGGVKSLLNHPAPDLGSTPVSAEKVEAGIEKAEAQAAGGSVEPEDSEYGDLVNVEVKQDGIYAKTENGDKRICGVAFQDPKMLLDITSGRLLGMVAVPVINGKPNLKEEPLDLDTFESVQKFNRSLLRYGHAFQGNDSHIRSTFMRLSESAKKAGNAIYTTSREGMDILHVPNVDDPVLNRPFLVWVSESQVIMPKAVAEAGFKLRFQGYPDPRGQFRSDVLDAPMPHELLKERGAEYIESVFEALLNCQSPQFMSKMIGWMTACYFRMLFHKAYTKFPLLHVNGAAGSGKTETTKALLSMFYYNSEPRVLSPTSTTFALTYSGASSVTPPLVIDEYKPHEMPGAMHDKLKLMFRDAYNGREVQRGGGSRDSEDYRTLHTTQLTAPVVFIAEAMEEEAALMERVVLATMVRPNDTTRQRQMAHYMHLSRNKNFLTSIGQGLISHILEDYSMEKFREEFDPIMAEALQTYTLTEKDLTGGTAMSADQLRSKQAAKERSVYNYAVALFGLRKFRQVIGFFSSSQVLQERMDELENAVFTRMTDLAASTQPEWIKVLNVMAEMSYIDQDTIYAIKEGVDYGYVTFAGKDCLEIYTRQAYAKYRMYCRALNSRPLFAGEEPFVHSINDSSALVKKGHMDSIQVPGGTHLLGVDALIRAGFRVFKM